MAIKNMKSLRQLSTMSIPTENLIYFHHIDNIDGHAPYIIIPVDPDSIQDTMSASFASNMPLSRSAPIYSYQNSGPRSIQLTFTLHRDLCREYNPGGFDAVDELIRNLEACVLPDYQTTGKIVNPPLVSLQLRNEIYIKGVVTNSVGKTFRLPIINYGTNGEDNFKYAVVDLSFGISEVTPYSASIIGNLGPNRGRRINV